MKQLTAIKRSFWTLFAFYFLIGFEFFYMASPFAIYFYSVYGPGLNLIQANPTLAWLSSAFLPHIVVETTSGLINVHGELGAAIFILGLIAFFVGAGQVYFHKLARKGAVISGIYNFVRHPQYAALACGGFGLLLMWPRYIHLLTYAAMLFAYYFLAMAEEKECAAKFDESYLEYRKRTNMFTPFKLPPGIRISPPLNGRVGLLRTAALYLLVSLLAVGLANLLNRLSLDSLYALYSKDAVYIFLFKTDRQTIAQMAGIALADNEIQAKLKQCRNDRFINYVLPAAWYVSEIHMNKVAVAE